MTKILKKSLACLLVFVLCFTAIAGCLSVSAAAPAATFDYKTYFPNDDKVWAACAGQNVRAQLSMENLEAGATIGVSVEIPEGAEITSVDGWSVNTSCALSEVSSYFDEENSIFTIIYDVTVSGNYTLFVRYNITEEVAKKVHHMNAKFEAAFASDDEIKQITVTDYYEVFDHNVVTDEAVAPGCETTGLTEGSHCSICGEVFVAQEEVAALGHAWDEGVVDPDATCTDEGVITYTCANDPSHTYTEAISAKGHTEVAYEEVAATCTTVGYTGGTYCSVCDAVITPRTEVPALGHDYGEPVDNGNGTHTATCANDANHTITEDHEYVDGTCACGATKPAEGPVLDENLQFRDFDINVTHAVNIRYRIYANTTKGINGYKTLGYDKVEVVAYGTEYSFDASNLYNTVDVPETVLYKEDTSVGHNFFYQGISMISLGHKISVYIKAYDAQGNYVAYSPVSEASPEDLIKATIEKATTDNAKRTNVELLNMAAAAQEKFAADKAGTDLANDVAAGKLVNKNVDQTLAITTMPDLVAVDDTPVWEADIDTTFQTSHKISIGARLQQSPGIRLNIGGRTTLDQSKLRVEFTYFDPDKTVNTTVTKVVEGVDAVQNGARWAFDVPTLEFHNSDQTITGKVYYDVDDDGELELLGTIQYSIDASIKETIETSSNEKVIKLNEAIAKFGLAFRVNKGITTL